VRASLEMVSSGPASAALEAQRRLGSPLSAAGRAESHGSLLPASAAPSE
jgi:hypothetical protein